MAAEEHRWGKRGMDAIAEAFLNLLTTQHLFYLCLGTIIGLIVAILPGLGGTAGLSLVLPFVYGMDPTSALALMIGLLAPTATGDTFPAVLMGIPGSSASQATIMDGFPLAKQGEAARALSAAFSASLIGGLIGAIVLTASVTVARPLVLAIGLGEQFLLIVFALTMVGVLTGSTPLKGFACCGIGLLLGTIGAAPATGELRYTFGTVYLSDGIPLVVIALGIFAMPEIIELMRSGQSISEKPKLGKGWRHGIRDTLSHPWLVTRCSGIGCVIGALPGLGGSVVDWIAYGHVVQSSKDRERFGKGDIRGVIAPESANNAVRGGELIPTLFFGIPGSGSMAVLLGGFILIGINPGLRMIGSDLHLTYTVIWSLALSNILAAALCIILAQQIAKLTTVPYGYIGPPMMVLLVFTAFQATRDWGDILAFLACSALGVGMKRFDWSRPALVIGFVLASGFEASTYQAVQVYGFSFLQRPQSLVLVVLILLSLLAGFRVALSSRSQANRRTSTAIISPSSKAPQVAFALVLAAVPASALIGLWELRNLTQMFPAAIAAITLALLLVLLFQQLRSSTSHPVLFDAEQSQSGGDSGTHGISYYACWTLGLVAMVWLLGYTIGAAVFVLAFLTVELQSSIWRNGIFAIGVIALLSSLSYWLFLSYPPGVLPELLDLPWWLQ